MNTFHSRSSVDQAVNAKTGVSMKTLYTALTLLLWQACTATKPELGDVEEANPENESAESEEEAFEGEENGFEEEENEPETKIEEGSVAYKAPTSSLSARINEFTLEQVVAGETVERRFFDSYTREL